MKIISVVGARPNFMKIAPFIRAIDSFNKANSNSIDHILLHTGQHYIDKMSTNFFSQLGIPHADINLGIGSEHDGASVLVGNNIDRIREEYYNTLNQKRKPERPELWDGKTADKCLEPILNYEEKE